MKISVAMATYNGAAYLGEQLDSLARQERLPDELVICDDGSSDDTLTILDAFAAAAPFPVRVHRNERNLGFADNFFKAAGLCEGNWIAFCDQDDVWLPNKLSDAAAAIAHDPTVVLVLQNARLCDTDLHEIRSTFPNSVRPGTYGPNRQHGFWYWFGFLQTVSAALLKNFDHISRPTDFNDARIQCHDRWACMIANALGGVIVLGRPAALYRRHERAVTGDHERETLPGKVITSLSVGADSYRAYAALARETADYLGSAAGGEAGRDWNARVHVSAQMFRKLARVLMMRAELYSCPSRVGRIGKFFGLLFRGGFFGPRFVALGAGSAAKDLFVALRGSASERAAR